MGVGPQRYEKKSGPASINLMSADVKRLLAYCEQHRDWLLEAVERLVRLESPSTDKAAVDRCGAAVEELLVAAGGRVQRLPQALRGDHLRAGWEGGERQVLVLGHFDTVWSVGQLERMPLRTVDGRLYGPGVFDMKAGIGVAMLAVRALQALAVTPLPRIVMLWTSDEEIGSGSSRALIEEEARRSDAVLVLEPSLPGGAAKTSRKGVGEFELAVHGVSAHAGIDPGKGASAIHELARQILAVEALQDLPRGISVNVGIVAGGSRANVVAGYASAKIDVRVPTMTDAASVEAALYELQPKLTGTRLEVTGSVDRPPFERSPGVFRLYQEAKAAASALGRNLSEGSTGGGSDGNFTGALGVPTLDGLGPMGDGAHALNEHVDVADLPWRAAFVAALLMRLR
jgi:glutamate carboxypeptidase